MFPGDVAVRVPAFFKELHESHSALAQAPGEQAVVGKRHLSRLGTVRLLNTLRFARQIGQLGDGSLYAIRQLVLPDARGDGGIANDLLPPRVESADQLDLFRARGGTNAVRVFQIQHRRTLRAERCALVFRRQKARAPVTVQQWLHIFAGHQHHVRRQVFVF